MRPSHPCGGCGHATVEDCALAASRIPPRARAVCEQCADPCLSIMSEPSGLSESLADNRF